MPGDRAILRDIAPEPFTTIPPGIDVTLTVEMRAGDKPFKKGTYLLDIEPRDTEVKEVTSLTKDAEVKIIGNRPEDRTLELQADLPELLLQLVIGTPQNTGSRDVSVALKQGNTTLAKTKAKLNISNVLPALGKTVTSNDVVANDWRNDVVLSAIIKKGLGGLAFVEYQRFMDILLCGESPVRGSEEVRNAFTSGNTALVRRRFLPFSDTDAYRLLKVATEAFVAVRSVVCPDFAITDTELKKLANSIGAANLPADPLNQYVTQYLQRVYGSNRSVDGILPYYALIQQKLDDYPLKDSIFAGVAAHLGETISQDEIRECTGVLLRKLQCPIMIELIWSYWHEQGMQVQTMFAIRDRFQNRRGAAAPDPLAAMEIGYLRPLNNVLWGYIQDEQHRLTITRRCYEYDHHYGLTLQGKAVPSLQPVDSRGKFLEAFHNLLYVCTVFYKEDDDTNIKADAFPVLNAIKEVHFLLSEGAHNQYGDLPTTARIEMLLEQWLLARPEMREFLPSRESIAYPEEWMGPVDAMKTIQGWTNTSVMYFHDLAVFGEQILLSIRFNNWSQVFDRANAALWARIWRSEIQAYMHAYRTVTGVDLALEPSESRLQERKQDPSVLLMRRLDEQRRLGTVSRGGMRLPASPSAGIRVPEPRRIGRR